MVKFMKLSTSPSSIVSFGSFSTGSSDLFLFVSFKSEEGSIPLVSLGGNLLRASVKARKVT